MTWRDMNSAIVRATTSAALLMSATTRRACAGETAKVGTNGPLAAHPVARSHAAFAGG
jgi:hypothetical protein